MKLCKDCAFFVAPSMASLNVGAYSKCQYGLQVSPVSGERDVPTQSGIFCSSLRSSDRPEDCGAAAKFFADRRLKIVPDSTADRVLS